MTEEQKAEQAAAERAARLAAQMEEVKTLLRRSPGLDFAVIELATGAVHFDEAHIIRLTAEQPEGFQVVTA